MQPLLHSSKTMLVRCLASLLTLGCVSSDTLAKAEEIRLPSLKSESFDHDPGWEGYNNHVLPKRVQMVKQDFGYSLTSFAGKSKGELGGSIQRSTKLAYYAAPLTPAVTLEEKLSASGSFAVTASAPSAGLFFGFFNSQQPGGSGRPIGSLGLDLGFERKGGRLAVRLITAHNKSCGTFITPYLPGKFRPSPVKNDGTRYYWTLDYDPLGGGGNGRFTFTLRSDNHPANPMDDSLPESVQQETRSRFPYTTSFNIDLPPELRKEGATFDRFGMLNALKGGNSASVYFADLQFNGKTEDFTKDPSWIGSGNRLTYEDREQTGAHDFGYSPTTQLAEGAKPGEVGGSLWRSSNFAYYADRIGPLTMEQKLEAHGKVRLVTAGPDSDMFIGWFNSSSREKSTAEAASFIGIHVGGPTRVGHYFLPGFATAKGSRGKVKQGPILTPGQVFDWSVTYDPEANQGQGEIRSTLGSESVVLPLRPGEKAEGAEFDRFGLFTSTAGGQMVKIYLDDLQYTANRPQELPTR